MKNVVVAFGGVSPEHEVSVLTGMQAFFALDEKEWNRIPLYVSKSGRWYTGDHLTKLENYEDLAEVTRKATPCMIAWDEVGRPVLRDLDGGLFRKPASRPLDIMLLAFHGGAGENGSFQGLCEQFGIPYTGPDLLSSAIGMDKVLAKELCRLNGVPVVESCHFREVEWIDQADAIRNRIDALGWPVVVKPVRLGSSIGVAVAADRKELDEAVEAAFRYDEHILVEKAVQPLMEINCSVLGTPDNCRASVCERPIGSEELLSFQDKYMNDGEGSKGMASASRVIPADIPDELTRSIRETSQKVFRILGVSGVARLDFLVNADTLEFWFNEINTIPGSFSFYLWKATGTGFRELLHELIALAEERHRQQAGRIRSYETNLLSRKASAGIKGLKGLKS